MNSLIFTDRTPDLLNLMVSLFGVSVYDTFTEEDVIVFNMETDLWYTQYKRRIKSIGLYITNDQFTYITELYQLGIVLTKSEILNTLNQIVQE